MWKIVAAGAVVVGSALISLSIMLVIVVSTDPRPPEGVVCAPPGGEPGDPVAGFEGPQLANAAAIVAAGTELGAPQRAHVVAVATAMQESQLLMYANDTVPESLLLPHDRVGSDHDSVGLFQQRAGWGSLAERMDPKASAALFYRALLTVPDWESMPLTVAAQRVQISAFPDAYAKWELPANEVVGAVAGIVCTGGGPDRGGRSPAGIHHVGLHLGDGRVAHAPETGSAAEIVAAIWDSSFWSSGFIGAVRPSTTPSQELPSASVLGTPSEGTDG